MARGDVELVIRDDKLVIDELNYVWVSRFFVSSVMFATISCKSVASWANVAKGAVAVLSCDVVANGDVELVILFMMVVKSIESCSNVASGDVSIPIYSVNIALIVAPVVLIEVMIVFVAVVNLFIIEVVFSSN